MPEATTHILRATLSGKPSVYRDIEIARSDSLYDLAEGIVQAFGFDFPSIGIREVSVTPVAIAGVKDSLSAIDSTLVRALAEKALEASDPAEVERLFRSTQHG